MHFLAIMNISIIVYSITIHLLIHRVDGYHKPWPTFSSILNQGPLTISAERCGWTQTYSTHSICIIVNGTISHKQAYKIL